MHLLSSSKKFQTGQGLVEYALILVLVSIVVIAALMILGPTIGTIFSQINSSLSGVDTSGVLPPPVDCSSQEASLIAANNAFNTCMADHHNEAHHCQPEQNAVDNANFALQACLNP